MNNHNVIMVIDYNHDVSEAFFRALDERRLMMCEVKHYSYCGKSFGKDIFVNKVTGDYLD